MQQNFLKLRFRHHDLDAIECLRHNDLATEPAVWARLQHTLEHVFFHAVRSLELAEPGFVDVAMAGGATAGTAAFAYDAIDHVIHGALHDRRTDGDLYFITGTIVGDVGNQRHLFPLA